MPSPTPTTPPDPFDPDQNPIGTKGLATSYVSTANNLILGQSYSSLLASQMSLDVSAIDVALAVKVSAYQKQLKGYAGYFLGTLTNDFIRLVSDANNMATLIGSFVEVERGDILGAWSDEGARRNLVISMSALSDGAGEVFVDAGTLVNHVSEADRALGKLSEALDAAIESTIADLDTSMKLTVQSIDKLNEAISQNIDDIVSGANVVGGAVKDLGLGILTMISGEVKEPAKPTKPGEGDPAGGDGDKDAGKVEPASTSVDPKKDTKPPSVDFVVTAIRSGASGAEKWSAAQRALEANNEKLAAAYQSLAQQSAVLAVAKVVQAQKELFVTSVDGLLANVNELKMNWAAVRDGLQRYGNSLQTVPDQTGAIQLASLAQGARTLWSACSGEFAGIKQSMTAVGQGGLPKV